jgi:hypothetical protein
VQITLDGAPVLDRDFLTEGRGKRRARQEPPQTHVIVEHYKDPAAVSAHGRKLIADLKDLTEGRPEVMTLVWVSRKHP